MLKAGLKHCRYSGLTDVRTVSDDLSSSRSSGFFSEATDQTMAMTPRVGQIEFKQMIDQSIIQFINPVEENIADLS